MTVQKTLLMKRRGMFWVWSVALLAMGILALRQRVFQKSMPALEMAAAMSDSSKGPVDVAPPIPATRQAANGGDAKREIASIDRRVFPAGEAPNHVDLEEGRAQRIKAAGRLKAEVPGVRVDFDETLGSPKFIGSTQGFLAATGRGQAVPVSAADARSLVASFVDGHTELFGHGAANFNGARLVRDYETPHNGMRTMVWQQELDGVRVFESTLQAHVTRKGELVNVASRLLPDPAAAAENREASVARSLIDVKTAISTAAQGVGDVVAPGQIAENAPAEGATHMQNFRAARLLDVSAQYVWLPLDEARLRLSWEVIFTSKARGEMFRTIVDAGTGETLVRQRLTEYISPASYRVFTSDSPTPMSPGLATPGTTQPAAAARALVTLDALDTTASPNGWIDDGVNETRGNNVDAHLDLNADDVADTPRPQGSPNRVFDFALDLAQSPGAYRDAAVTNLFYWNNVIHDRFYQLGFTEAAGNFQNNNFGRGGFGSDAVQADAQDGSGTNNANFSTPPDGSPGRMQMYVFTGPSPARDGDFDQEIVIHEYTHGLSNRLVGGGVGISSLQPRGMGEGWSDFYGLCLLSEPADNPNGTYAAGAYASYQLVGLTQNYYYGIRRYPYCTNLAKNPLTFKDIDPSQASSHSGVPVSPIFGGGDPSEVHSQGEVWCVTLWDARANLIAKHGAAAGNSLILQLVTDGMKLAPANPTFLQARDAILQADLVNNAGANRGELWTAFAKRGMGSAATSPSGNTTFGIVENYDVPDDLGVGPAGVWSVTATVGGPFTATRACTLVNSGAAPLNWTAVKTQPWLVLSATGGTLAPGATASVTASFNAAANNLLTGSYADTITFTNVTSGLAQQRAVALTVEPFTIQIASENWESGTAGSAWAITGTNSHRTLVTTANGPHGGNYHLTMDSSVDGFYSRNEATWTVNLAGRSNVQLRFWVKMFNDEDDGPPPSPFIGGADFDGIAISADGTTWYEVQPLRTYVSDWTRYVVDLDAALAAHGLSYNSSFKIRFNHYDNYGIDTDGFAFDDIELVEIVNNRLTLTIPATMNESAVLFAAGLSVVPTPANDLTVTLASSDPGLATPPASVVIPAGQSSVVFAVTLHDDSILNGTRRVQLSATAPSYVGGSAALDVEDNETATLTLSIPQTATEGDTNLLGTVTLSAPAGADVSVALQSSNGAEVQVPSSVTVLAGQASATFPITIVDDNRIDGTVTTGITAHMANWTDATASIAVADNENTNLVVNFPATVREGDGPVAGTVRIGGTLTTALIVTLSSSDTTELTVPATVTIPAGQTSANFTATVVDDTEADGAQSVNIVASAAGFGDGTATTSVADNDAHHFAISAVAATQIRNVPFAITVTAQDVNGATITNFNSPVILAGTVPVTPSNITAWTNGEWTGNVTATAFGTGVVLTVNDGFGHSGASNPFDVTHGPVSSFAWSTIASPQYVDAPFSATIRALDAAGNSVPTFAGPVSLAALRFPPVVEIGTGTSTTILPFLGYYRESRLQTLYPASEMGGPATLSAISLNVASVSSGTYSNFTVRLKHSSLTTYTTAAFDAAGWTEVYRAAVTPSATGQLTLPFTAPFDYDGTSSLVVDISFDNAVPVTQAYIYNTYRTNRAIYGYDNGTFGDPRTWSGTTGYASMITDVPNLRFTVGAQAAIPLSPATTGAFVAGEWTGDVSVPFTTAALQLRATSGALTGDSNVFAVTTVIPPSNSATVFAEDFESGTLNPAYWTVTGIRNFHVINSNLNTPHGGTRHMTMDASTYDGTYSRNEATLTLNLAGRTGVTLSFWAKEFNDIPHGPPASPFPSTGADFDGVAISADGGANWYEVQALRTLTGAYAQFTVDLDAALAARGLSYSPNFKIRFNQYGNDYIPWNGIAIDDILITASYPAGTPSLTLPSQVTEGAGVVNGTVSVPAALGANLVLNLSSKAAAKITVPATVTIPAGQTFAVFPLMVLDDPFIDGTKSVLITVTGPGFFETGAVVQVVDNDGGALTLTLPATMTEGVGTVTGTVSLSVPALVPITVALTPDDATEVTVPASVTVPAGKTSVTFNANAIDDGIVDGTQYVTFTAHAAGWTDGTASISVLDNGRDARLEWPTYGNGPGHTGYQPLTLGTDAYQAGWTKTFPRSVAGLNQVALSDGMIFVTPYVYYDDTYLSALDASTGTELWRKPFATAFSINPPSVNAGRVYAQRSNYGDGSQLWCLDATSGTTVWSAPFAAQTGRYFAPTVVNDGVWVNGGYYGGLYGFNTSNGSQRFFNSSLEFYDQWTPSYYNGTIYTWVAGIFRAHDPMDGRILWSSILGTGSPYSANTVPTMDGGKAFAVETPWYPATGHLFAIDVTTHATAWTVSGTFKGSPAVANGVVYALNDGDVKAYSSQTGALVGTYATGDFSIAGQPIVTNDALIVTSNSNTYIFNLQTFALKQTLASGGVASLASGVLYLAGTDGVLRTFYPGGMTTITVAMPAAASEGSPTLTGTVTLSKTYGTSTLISLASDGPSRLTVPASVTIPANQASATFQLSVVDDLLANGSQDVTITARGPTYVLRTGTAAITIHDNEAVILTLTAPSSVTEGGTVQLTVGMNVAPSRDIVVSLASSDSREMLLPPTVVIPAGQTSVTFNATAVNDGVIDGTQTVTLTAHVGGWTDGAATLNVLDNGRDVTPDWPTFGNGPGHTGYQPITLGTNTYLASWTAAFPTSTSGLNQVAVSNGEVFVTPYTYFGDTYLSALNASTGGEIWRQTFASSYSINPPTVNAGKVYVEKGNSITQYGDSQLRCLNAATGATVWIAPVGAQWERYFAPTVVNDGVWVDGGTYGGLYGFNTNNGSQRFFNYSLGQYDQWTPSYYQGTIYTWVAGVFRAHDPTTGTTLWSSVLGTGTYYSGNTVPAMDAGKAFAVEASGYFYGGHLYAIDVTTHATAWTVTGTFKGSPAVANGTVFVLNGGDVQAYSSQTGVLVGTYATGDVNIAGQPIVTNDALIVTSYSNTYIFNLQTFALRQTLANGGVASLANGVLYLAGADGVLRTFRPSGQNTIALSFPASSATEGGPGLTGTVSLASVVGGNTVIKLSAGGSSRVTLPASITIPAGQSSATFQLSVVDDSLLNGSETVLVRGSGPSYLFMDGNAVVTIQDNETATITLSVPASAAEGAGSVTGTVTLSAAPAINISVSLTSSDTTEATVPATVTVLAGETTATFPIGILDDTEIDGTQTVTFTASVAGWPNDSATMQVTDNENRNLTLYGPYSAYEGQISGASVYISGTLPSDLVVTLTSSNPAQYSVPASVTIPAGQTSAFFFGTAVDDTATDGTQTVTITASAPTFTSASVTASAFDNDVHHFGFSNIVAPQKAGVPFTVTVSAQDVNGVVIPYFSGTANLSAAGDGGAVTITPASTGYMYSGSWTGFVTCNTAGANVRLTASSGGITGTSNAFDVQASPSIALSSANLTLALGQGQTATRTLTISNAGGGTLTWNLATSSLAGVVSSGPEFAGHAQVVENKRAITAPVRPEPPQIHLDPRAASAARESVADLSLQSALNNLNANNGLVRGVIPNRYPFSEGVTGSGINDGGDDMYDGGNYLGTNLGSYLSYSDNIIATASLLGTGGQYFTRKYDGLWVFAGDVSGLTYFQITGNLGADGSGSTDSAVLSVVRGGVTYRGFVKRVYNAGDPSVNHLIVVADNGSVTHEVSTNTNDDYHRLTNLTGVTRIYHVLYAGTSGAYIDNTATLNIMSAFLDAIGTPDWISPSPVSGSVAAGTSQDVTLAFDSATLTPGTYSRTLPVSSNDPFQPQVSFPVTLTVTTEPYLDVTPAAGLSAGGLRGGPFTPSGRGFTLTNTGIAPLTWSVTNTAAWLSASPGGGTLAPGASTSVTATLNAAAASLASGSFAGTLTFTNATNGLGNTTRPVALTVLPAGDLVVTPGTNLNAGGPFGGPFTPGSATYTLTNSGDAALDWIANKTATWLTLSASGGTLAAGASTDISVTFDAAALEPGSYSDTVTFDNTTTGRGDTTRTVGLLITLPAPVFAPEPPVTGGTGNTVSWNPIFGADAYEVQRATDAVFTSPVSSGWIAGTSQTFAGLAEGQSYRYRVRSQRTWPESIGTWMQTTQAEFDTDTKVGVVANPSGNVTLVSGNGASLARVLNPSFESYSNGNTATNWTITTSGQMNLEIDGIGVPAPPMPTHGSVFAILWTYWSTHAAGDYIQISQSVDLTGAGTLMFDGVLSNWNGGTWGNAIRAEMRIDGVTRWTATAAGAYVNQSVDVSALTGVHSVEFRSEVINPGNDQSQWFCIDNIRTLAPSGYVAVGTLTSPVIAPAPRQRWTTLGFTKDTSSAGTALTVDVLDASGALLAANVANGADLNAIPTVASQPSIRLRANLSTGNSANTPHLDDWTVAWQSVASGTATSVWSDTATSLQDATPPTVSVTSPGISSGFVHTLTGTASDANGVFSIIINGELALTADGFAHWSFPSALRNGLNTFNIVVRDNAIPPNTTTMVWNVTATFADLDGDGLPDTWEALHGLSTSDGTGRHGAWGDLDGDGLPNVFEYIANLDPSVRDAAAACWTTLEIKPEDGRKYMVVHHRQRIGLVGWNVGIETCTSLTAWNPPGAFCEESSPATLLPDGATRIHHHRVLIPVDDPGGTKAFVRLRVTAQ